MHKEMFILGFFLIKIWSIGYGLGCHLLKNNTTFMSLVHRNYVRYISRSSKMADAFCGSGNGNTFCFHFCSKE